MLTMVSKLLFIPIIGLAMGVGIPITRPFTMIALISRHRPFMRGADIPIETMDMITVMTVPGGYNGLIRGPPGLIHAPGLSRSIWLLSFIMIIRVVGIKAYNAMDLGATTTTITTLNTVISSSMIGELAKICLTLPWKVVITALTLMRLGLPAMWLMRIHLTDNWPCGHYGITTNIDTQRAYTCTISIREISIQS